MHRDQFDERADANEIAWSAELHVKRRYFDVVLLMLPGTDVENEGDTPGDRLFLTTR